MAVALVLLTGCAPALTLRRLSPPSGAIGPGRTISLTVSGVTDSVGTTEPVEHEVREAFAERLKALAYTVCPAAPCGDGALEVSIEEAHFSEKDIVKSQKDAELEAKMQATFAAAGFTATTEAPRKQVSTSLKTRVTYTQKDGLITYRRPHQLEESLRGITAEIAHQTVRKVAAAFAEQLSRQMPFDTVQLEGGGPLNEGVTLFHQKKWKAAVAYFAKLTAEKPDLDGAWYDLGFAQEVEGDWPAALTAYREALKRSPQKPHYEKAATTAAKVLTLY